jgi:hypothetical protein
MGLAAGAEARLQGYSLSTLHAGRGEVRTRGEVPAVGVGSTMGWGVSVGVGSEARVGVTVGSLAVGLFSVTSKKTSSAGPSTIRLAMDSQSNDAWQHDPAFVPRLRTQI